MSAVTPSTDPLIGQQVGNYRVLSALGAGGMGAVYLAEHPEIGRRVAIKVLAAHMVAQPQAVERFINEARAVTRIGHPGIVEIYDFGRTAAGLPYYVMELLRGKELAAHMAERGPLSAAELLPLLEQICSALGAAHGCGVVHRDLKPENIFLLDGAPPRVKLLDFGVAKLLEPELGVPTRTATGCILGTPYTISPEQAAGMPDAVSPRTDLYSLGVVLYWALAGSPPFHSVPTAVLLAKHVTDPPPPLLQRAPRTPPAVAAVVERCLEKDPAKRFASAAELHRAFAEAALAAPPPTAATPIPPTLLGGEVTLPPLSTPAPRESPAAPSASGRRPWLWIAVVAGALLVGGAVAAAMLWPSRPATELAAVPAAADAAPSRRAPDLERAVLPRDPAARAALAADARRATWSVAGVGEERAGTPPDAGRAPAPLGEIVYRARLGARDHQNRLGQRLTSAAAVLRQDRANVHAYGLRDAEDGADPLFADKDARTRLELLARRALSPAVAAAILRGSPLVEVRVRGASVTVVLVGE